MTADLTHMAGQLVWVLSVGLPAWPGILTHPFEGTKHVWTARQQRTAAASEAAARSGKIHTGRGHRPRKVMVVLMGSYELISCAEVCRLPHGAFALCHTLLLLLLFAFCPSPFVVFPLSYFVCGSMQTL